MKVLIQKKRFSVSVSGPTWFFRFSEFWFRLTTSQTLRHNLAIYI